METRVKKKTTPTLSARVPRDCPRCGRRLPRRSHKQQCSTCIKAER